MITLFLCVALAQAPAEPPTGPAEPTARDAAQLDGATERLRRMLGEPSERPLRLDDLLVSIDRRNPRLRAALLGIDKAQGALQSARGFLDPELRLGAQSLVRGYYGYNLADAAVGWDTGALDVYGGWRAGVDAWDRNGIPVYYGDKATLAGGELRAGASLPLLRGLITDGDRTGVRVADADLMRAEAVARGIDVALRQRSAGAWIGWVAAGRMLALERALLDIAEDRQRSVRARVSVGDLAALEELRVEQFLTQRRAAFENAAGRFEGEVQQLGLYLRDDAGDPARAGLERLPTRDAVPTEPIARDLDALVARAIEQHPDLLALRADVQRRQAMLRLAKNDRLPSLSVFGEASQDFAGDGTVDDSLSPFKFIVGARGTVPTLNRKARGTVAKSDAELKTAQAYLQWATEKIAASVRRAGARERATTEAWRATSRAVDLALRIQQAEQRRFDLGEIDLLRLWQIEQETAKSIRTEVKAWAAYELASAELRAALGGLDL